MNNNSVANPAIPATIFDHVPASQETASLDLDLSIIDESSFDPRLEKPISTSSTQPTAPPKPPLSDRIKYDAHADSCLKIDPHIIQPSAFANRSDFAYVGDDFRQLKESILSTGGNSEPICVRPIRPSDRQANRAPSGMTDSRLESPPIYEIVSGHRRWSACQALQLPVWARVIEVSDVDLAMLMFMENNLRENPSPYELGAMFHQWKNQGWYRTQDEIACAVNRHKSDVSRCFFLADPLNAFVKGFINPLHLHLKDADDLRRLRGVDNKFLAVLTDTADRLISNNQQRHRQAVFDAFEKAVQQAATPKSPTLDVSIQGPAAVVGSTNFPGAGPVGSTNNATAGAKSAGTPACKPRRQKIKLLQGAGEIVWDASGCPKVSIAQAIPASARDEFEKKLAALVARMSKAPVGQDAASTGVATTGLTE